MAFADEILSLLATAGLGTVGTTLFKDELPDRPDVCGALFHSAGAPPQFGLGVDGIQYEMPGAQIRFRGEAFDNSTPRAKVQTAMTELAKVQARTVSGTLYLMIRPTGHPFRLERDAKNRITWAVNITAEKEPS